MSSVPAGGCSQRLPRPSEPPPAPVRRGSRAGLRRPGGWRARRATGKAGVGGGPCTRRVPIPSACPAAGSRPAGHEARGSPAAAAGLRCQRPPHPNAHVRLPNARIYPPQCTHTSNAHVPPMHIDPPMHTSPVRTHPPPCTHIPSSPCTHTSPLFDLAPLQAPGVRAGRPRLTPGLPQPLGHYWRVPPAPACSLLPAF